VAKAGDTGSRCGDAEEFHISEPDRPAHCHQTGNRRPEPVVEITSELIRFEEFESWDFLSFSRIILRVIDHSRFHDGYLARESAHDLQCEQRVLHVIENAQKKIRSRKYRVGEPAAYKDRKRDSQPVN
jgi:hypothetical protein